MIFSCRNCVSTLADLSVQSSPSASPGTRRRNAIVVHLKGTKSGLGIKVVGGRNFRNPEKDFGIYIKDIVSGYLADKNGESEHYWLHAR